MFDLAHSEILKSVCEQLNCYKITSKDVVTRCIYCGDSRKRLKNHGHFYIYRHGPFAYCFRCGEGYNLFDWSYDVEEKLGLDLEEFRNELSNFVFSSENVLEKTSNDKGSRGEKINLRGKVLDLSGEYVYDLKSKKLTYLGAEVGQTPAPIYFFYSKNTSNLFDVRRAYLLESFLDAYYLSKVITNPGLVFVPIFGKNYWKLVKTLEERLGDLTPEYRVVFDSDVTKFRKNSLPGKKIDFYKLNYFKDPKDLLVQTRKKELSEKDLTKHLIRL